MTSFRYNGIIQPKVSFYMEYEIKHYYRVKYTLLLVRNIFLKDRRRTIMKDMPER